MTSFGLADSMRIRQNWGAFEALQKVQYMHSIPLHRRDRMLTVCPWVLGKYTSPSTSREKALVELCQVFLDQGFTLSGQTPFSSAPSLKLLRAADLGAAAVQIIASVNRFGRIGKRIKATTRLVIGIPRWTKRYAQERWRKCPPPRRQPAKKEEEGWKNRSKDPVKDSQYTLTAMSEENDAGKGPEKTLTATNEEKEPENTSAATSE
ncbi:MAG: hypothetical protein LQ345_007210 [Seirophora villosa]|nr:MAG: hypothetical protein LQ345_007210 [Seirophora villosa]